MAQRRTDVTIVERVQVVDREKGDTALETSINDNRQLNRETQIVGQIILQLDTSGFVATQRNKGLVRYSSLLPSEANVSFLPTTRHRSRLVTQSRPLTSPQLKLHLVRAQLTLNYTTRRPN